MSKVLAFCVIAVLLWTSAATAGTSICIRIDQKRDAYGEVDEFFDPHLDEGYYTLTCRKEGEKECKFTQHNPWPRLTGYAQHQIEIGIYAGTHQEVQGNLRLTVTWQVTPAYTEIIETQEEITGIE